MPNFNVNSDATAQSSQTLLTDVTSADALLTKIKTNVDGLLSNGYQTPTSEQKFRPFAEEFQKNFQSVNEALDGMAQYLRGVGQTFEEADTQLGAGLG